MKKLAIMLVSLAVPLMLMSTPASAWHHSYRYHCCGCYAPKNMSLVYYVVKRLRAEPATSDQPIYVTARGREVMLSGFVGTSMQRQEAVDIARYTCGVRLVVDNLHMQAP